MQDLISRQAAIDAIESTDWYHLNKNGEMVHGVNSAEQHAWYKAEDVYKALEELPFDIQPTIEPKLIHCKDCKWWRHNLCDYMDDEFFMNGLVIARADDYCSYAERRTDDER